MMLEIDKTILHHLFLSLIIKSNHKYILKKVRYIGIIKDIILKFIKSKLIITFRS